MFVRILLHVSSSKQNLWARELFRPITIINEKFNINQWFSDIFLPALQGHVTHPHQQQGLTVATRVRVKRDEFLESLDEFLILPLTPHSPGNNLYKG